MTRRQLVPRTTAVLLVLCMLLAACGQTVLVREMERSAGGAVAGGTGAVPGAAGGTGRGGAGGTGGALAQGGSGGAGGGAGAGAGQAGGGAGGGAVASPGQAGGGPSGANSSGGGKGGGGRNVASSSPKQRCATTASDTGVTKDSITWGTILPLSGPTRPLGEQTARVMKRAVAYYNTLDHDPGRPDLNWGCPGRKGIYGREVQLEIASISSDSEDDALQAMRRLVDVEHAFLVRDCYLQSSLMGPAHDYAERNGVTTFWCYPESLPVPQLAPHTWALGSGRHIQAALLAGHLVEELGSKRIGMLYDPTYEQQAQVVRQVVEGLGADVVEEVQARAQTAVNGRRSEVLALRNAGVDGVIVLDALNATYAGVAAGQLQWRPQDSGVPWACNNCWLKFQADVCGENCATMITNTSGVPFVPYNGASKQLWDAKQRIFPNEPNDVLTFASILITSGLFIYSAEAGLNLTRERLENVFAGLRNYSGGGLPPITTGPNNHFGARADWLVEFTGRPWPNSFNDLSGGYVQLGDVRVNPAWTDPS